MTIRRAPPADGLLPALAPRYRAPECLLTDGFYTFKMDMWSVGCVMFEVMSLYPLFPGKSEMDQIAKIHDIIGTPSAALLAKIRKCARRPLRSPASLLAPAAPGKGRNSCSSAGQVVTAHEV